MNILEEIAAKTIERIRKERKRSLFPPSVPLLKKDA